MLRRTFLSFTAAAAAAAQSQRDWTNHEPVRYPDADVVSVDPAFEKYRVFNSAIRRHFVGCKWAEGPAWSGEGQYVVWSDVAGNRQYRKLEEDDHVSEFRNPSGHSNGNTFDFQGRQLSCEHLNRRVVRYELDGRMTVVAERYNGKRLNSPNDIVVHPDGGVWFSDPPYGILGNYEGLQATPELKEAVYRVDPQTAKVELVNDELDKPNGLCFSPDYKKLYVCDSGAPKDIQVFDVVANQLKNKKQFSNMTWRGNHGLADGIRADVDGNIWAGASGGANYDGVHVITPAGQLIGAILLPEICANLCFGGPRRNHLYMAASQSLYSVFVGTRGAHIC